MKHVTEAVMALDAHLAELTEKHSALKKKIEEETARPLADSLKITELKREKLRIKDEAGIEQHPGTAQCFRLAHGP